MLAEALDCGLRRRVAERLFSLYWKDSEFLHSSSARPAHGLFTACVSAAP